jgi:hypothetical protein
LFADTAELVLASTFAALACRWRSRPQHQKQTLAP